MSDLPVSGVMGMALKVKTGQNDLLASLQVSSKLHHVHVFASKELSVGCGKALGGRLLFPLPLKR